jgi:phosphopantothenoylcysteine decarboxylase/phosphopantothenate--cysteine ligase
MAVLEWDFQAPTPSTLGDHDVPLNGHHLEGKRIALMICGGIAAMKAPFLARALRKQGAEVQAFVSEEAKRYVSLDALEWSTVQPVITRLTSAAEHLSDARPFDAYLLAPATYNTINKAAQGIADGLLTSSLASVLGRVEQGRTQLLIAPTMHGSMHNSILVESCQRLQKLGAIILQPRDAYGKHNIPEDDFLVAAVSRAVSKSALKGRSILVTSGPTPVAIDNVRRITNKFTGKLGLTIALDLFHRGAEVHLIQGGGGIRPPSWLPHEIAHLYEDYRDLVVSQVKRPELEAGIFTAAVADYKPKQTADGKLPSGWSQFDISLEPTEKVIDLVHDIASELFMVTFKYQELLSHEELMNIGRERLKRFPMVVANRGEEKGPNGEHIAWLMRREKPPVRCVSKPAIARGICDSLEEHFGHS